MSIPKENLSRERIRPVARTMGQDTFILREKNRPLLFMDGLKQRIVSKEWKGFGKVKRNPGSKTKERILQNNRKLGCRNVRHGNSSSES
jgi:hypothetical protein